MVEREDFASRVMQKVLADVRDETGLKQFLTRYFLVGKSKGEEAVIPGEHFTLTLRPQSSDGGRVLLHQCSEKLLGFPNTIHTLQMQVKSPMKVHVTTQDAALTQLLTGMCQQRGR